jgi:hypothetical protein
MEIPKLGFEIVKKNKIMMPRPLKEYLGVKCVTNWYHGMATTLGLLGLMHDLHKNIIRELYGVDRCFGSLHCMLLMCPNKEVNFTLQ